MAEVFLNVMGNGYATTDAIPPMSQGEQFTIHFYPDGDSTLEDVRAFDSHDYYVALPDVVDNQLTMKWQTFWGNLYVDIYFSGSTPPEPEPEKVFPWWLFYTRKRKQRRIVNY